MSVSAKSAWQQLSRCQLLFNNGMFETVIATDMHRITDSVSAILDQIFSSWWHSNYSQVLPWNTYTYYLSKLHEACRLFHHAMLMCLVVQVSKHFQCCRCYSFLFLRRQPWGHSWSHFCFFLLSQHRSAVTFLFSVLLFWLISLCFSHSLLVNCLPLWPVCARAEWVLFSAGWPSWITQASCLAWIGIWFHLSLISGPPYSAHFVSYHASSCWLLIF